MAVEIQILSGSRQGERCSTTLNGFQVGGSTKCEVAFDPKRDSGARDRIVGFQLMEDGWRIQCLSDIEVHLNNNPVRGTTRIRSGDVIRLSPSGPEFSFRILGRVAPQVPVTSFASETQESQVVDSVADSDEASSNQSSSAHYWTIAAIASGIAILLLVGVMGWSVLSNDSNAQSSVQSQVSVSPSDGKQPVDSQTGTGRSPTAKGNAPASNDNTTVEEPLGANAGPAGIEAGATTSKAPADPWDAALEQMRKLVYVLAVEQPKTSRTWPVASSCAVGEHTLLTTASAITELATFQDKNWKLWAINDAGRVRAEIKLLRVHVGYTKSDEAPEQRIYFDVGLATVSQLLPGTATLATTDELNSLAPGFPVACASVPHDIEELSRFQDNEVQLVKGKSFIITALPPAPGPRLLHLRATPPQKPYGGPIIDSQGHVYATYAEAAGEPTDPAANLNIHYAPLVDGDLIKLGISAPSSEVWVEPMPPVAIAPPTEQPKSP